jgi:hypothetical protein
METNVEVACTDETCGSCKYRKNGYCDLFNSNIIEGKYRCAPCFKAERELKGEENGVRQ